MTSAHEALQRLKEGNKRFILGTRDPQNHPQRILRNELAAKQSPFAVILGCSDSRVPVEIVFDQEAGDLFVIRVAGNIVAPSQIGSVEFAIEQFGTRLVVVLGHSRCGAVTATLTAMQQPVSAEGRPLHSIDFIVNRIRPALQELLATELRNDPEDLLRRSVRANVRASAMQLRRGSQIIERQCERAGLLVVGAEYSLETGFVDFFDGVPNTESSQ